MYLSKVQIKNFRNLQDVTVELGEKVVLLGENGVGKSNFFEALQILLDSNYRALLGENDFSRGVQAFNGTTIEVHAWFSGFDQEKDKDLLAVLHDCHEKGDDTYKLSAIYRPKQNIPIQDAKTEDDYELIRFGGGNEKNTEAAKRFRQYVRLVVIPAVRDMSRDMQSWRTSPLRRLVDLIDLRNLQEFQEVAKDVRKASGKLQNISPIQNLQKDIRSLLGTFVEEQSFQPTIGLDASNPDDLQRLLTILVETGLPIDRTSLGISNVLYLITWLIYSERLRKASVKEGQYPEYVLLAVEEPEAHLHPHFQRLVFENVFEKEHLLLVSTHSPTIVSITDPRHFVILRRTGNGVTPFSTASFASANSSDEMADMENEKFHQDIRRFLDATRGEVVFAKGVLLVEGAAEMFLLPAFAKKMHESGKISHTLDGAGITVCNIYGSDFRPYIEFLGPKGLNIPLAILTDGDPIAKNGEKDGELEEYMGLKRGLNLAQRLNAAIFSEIKDYYDKKEWDKVRDALEKIGIFINDQTLEDELLKAGYDSEFCDVYSELGASLKQQNNFKKLIQKKDLEKIIQRIETTGMGKGRFAQRLANRLDPDRIPPYIEKAIRFLLKNIPQSVVLSQEITTHANDTEIIEENYMT